MSFPCSNWFSEYVFQDLSGLVKGRFEKCPFGKTLFVICHGIYPNAQMNSLGSQKSEEQKSGKFDIQKS